jgi:ribosomal protein S27E
LLRCATCGGFNVGVGELALRMRCSQCGRKDAEGRGGRKAQAARHFEEPALGLEEIKGESLTRYLPITREIH